MNRAARLAADIENSQRTFREQIYPAMTRQERVSHWLSATARGMRWQGESAGDKYSEFSPAWYRIAKEMEPDFDNIFKEAMERIGFAFDWEEYHKRIQE